LAAGAALCTPASASAHPVTGGTITIGHGAAGVTLGESRQDVLAKLGQPVMENKLGVMSYANDPLIFDLYRKGTKYIQQFVIAVGPKKTGAFKLSDGNHIFKKGGLKRLSQRYGSKLKSKTFDDGSPYYEIVTKLNGRKVLNDFPTDRKGINARVLDVFIVFA
jgi:hypothetical protein